MYEDATPRPLILHLSDPYKAGKRSRPILIATRARLVVGNGSLTFPFSVTEPIAARASMPTRARSKSGAHPGLRSPLRRPPWHPAVAPHGNLGSCRRRRRRRPDHRLRTVSQSKNPIAQAAEDSMRAEQVWTGQEGRSFSRLSPGGKQFVYTDWSTGDFYLKEIGSEESRPVTNKGPFSEDKSYAETAAISPDGEQIASGWYNDEFGMYELRVGPLPEPGSTDDGRLVLRSRTDRSGYIAALGWLSNERVLFVHMVGDEEPPSDCRPCCR